MANNSFFQAAVERANKKPPTTAERLTKAYNDNTQRGSTPAVETPVLDSAVKPSARQAFSPASSLEEFMGILPTPEVKNDGLDGTPYADVVRNEWKRMGVDNARDYAEIRKDYAYRGLRSGVVGGARDTVNYMGNTVQQGNQRFQLESAVENAVARAMASGNTGGKTYEELYSQYLKELQEKFKEEPLRKTVDWGEAYDQESERIAQELNVNEEARKDYQFNQAIGRMAPAIAVSATGNLAGGGMTLLGAGEAAKYAYTIGRVLSSAATFTSAAGDAYEDAKAHGIDDDQAMTYAATVGAIELATEAFSSGLGKIGGRKIGTGGVTDDFVEALAKKASSDPNVQNAIIYVGGVVGEGFEEWLSEWGDYAANRLLVGYDDRTVKDVWGDSKESFYQGAMMSSLLNITQLMQRGVPPKDAIRQGVDETAAEAGISPMEQVSPAAQAMARAATQNSVQETAPAQTDISPAARTMADVLTGKTANVENPYSSGDYSSTYTAADGAAIRKDAKTFRNVVAGIDTSVKDFFSRWRNGRKSHLGEKLEKLYLGKVTDAARQRISDLLGYDVTSKDYIITSDGVKHVFDQHGDAGKETARGNIPLTDDIIEKLPEVLANPDSIDLGHQESRGDRSGIVFQKAFPNGTIVYIQFDNSGRGTIEGKTIYAKKAATSSGVNADASANTFTSETTEPVAASTGLQSANVQAPASTPETSTATPVGTQNVSQAAENVNTEGVETRLSQTAETVRDAGITPEAVKQDINTGIENGKYRYIPESNADAISSVRSAIADKGYESVLRDWTAEVRSGKTSNDLAATGAVLYNEAVQSGNTRLALDILTDYQMLGTNTAQGLQAMRIIKDLTPQDRVYMIKKSIDKLYNNLSDGAKKKLPDGFNINEELVNQFVNAQDAKAEAAAMKSIQKDIARQIPNTFMDRLTALRYLNMLGNFRTQIRNLAGNTGMAVTAGVKNTVRYTLERALETATGGKYQRNTSLIVNPEMMKAARVDYDAHADFINGDAKYNDTTSADSFARGVKEQRRVFTSNKKLANFLMKIPDAASRATNWAMEKGDTVFIKQQYARYLGGYLEAHKMNADTFAGIINGDIQPTAEQLQTIDNGRVFAAKEAQEATFHDTNAFSKWFSQIGRNPGSPWYVRLASEGIAPFRKTPANVLVRSVEYSPLGFLDTVSKAVQAAQGKNGVSGADVVNSLSKSLTGTGLFALGMLLRDAGWLRGSEDDDEQDAFDKLQGKQAYSLIIPAGTIGNEKEISITIDWLSPAAIPTFMGAALMDEIRDGGFEVSDVLDVVVRLSDPMLQMSMLQGVNDALDSVKYSGNSLGQFALNAILSFAMQGMTNTMLGQAERTFEDRRYTTFLDADTPTKRTLQSKFGKALAKIPGIDYNQVEYVDAWGRTEYSGGLGARAFENFLSPGYLSKQNSTEVDNELQRLYDAGQTNVFPSRISMTDTVNVYRSDGRKLEDRRLTKDEYVQYQKVMGQTSLELVKDLMKSPVYQGMSDEAKASAISEIYGYAKRMAAMAVEPSAKFGEKTDVSKLSNPAAYYAANASFNTASKDSENRNYGELDSLTASFSRLPPDVRDAVTEGNAGLAKMLDAKENGYNARQYYNVYDTVKALTPAEGYANVATWQKIDAVCSMNTPDTEKDYFVMNYFEGSSKDKYTAAREAGYSPYSVAVAYREYTLSKNVDLDGDGRSDRQRAFISAMMAQGASKSSAEWLYKLFASNK